MIDQEEKLKSETIGEASQTPFKIPEIREAPEDAVAEKAKPMEGAVPIEEEVVTNDITSEDFDIEMEDVSTDEPTNLLMGDGKELVRMPPPKPPMLALVSEREANERAFYATQEIGSEEMNKDYQESRTQLMTEGRSDLEDQAEEEAYISNLESDQMAVESIVSDPTVDKETRKGAIKNYINLGFKPTSLKERYINQIAEPSRTATDIEWLAQDHVLSTVTERKNNQHMRVRNEQIDSMEGGFWDSFWGGLQLTGDQVFETAGLFGVTQEDVIKAKQEQIRVMGDSTLNQIGGGLGGMVAVLAPIALTPLAGLGTAGTIAASTQTASKFSDIGDTVAFETRLTSAVASGALTGVDVALPIFKAATLLRAVVMNGGANIAIGELDVYGQNTILEAFPELQQPQIDLANVTVNGVMGGLLGAAMGRKRISPLDHTRNGIPASSIFDSQKTGNPNVAADSAADSLAGKVDDTHPNVMSGGGDLGLVVQSWVHSKLVGTKDLDDTLNPNILTKLYKHIYVNNANSKALYRDFDIDSTQPDAVKRINDRDAMDEIIKANEGPLYSQSNSKVVFGHEKDSGELIFTNQKGGVYKSGKDGEIGRYGAAQMERLRKGIESSDAKDHGAIKAVKKDGGWVIAWEFERAYSPLSVGVLGSQPIKILGRDATWIARSKVGRWLIPTGVLGDAEKGASRSVAQESRLKRHFEDELDDVISTNRNPKEMDDLVNHAEEYAIDDFSIKELHTRYDNLSRAQAEELYTTWTLWRATMARQWQFANRQDRLGKDREGFKGIYSNGEGKPIGMGTPNLSSDDLAHLGKGKKYIWDFEKNDRVLYNADAFKKDGKTVVKLFESHGGKDQDFGYAILGDKVQLKHLPEVTLPKLKGYAPRHTKENFFIDAHPRERTIDGELIKDQAVLRQKLTTTKGAARTNAEGEQMKAQLEAADPDMIYTVRREKMDTVDQIAEDMNVKMDMTNTSKRKGERLPSLDGLARIEDRVVSAKKSIAALAKTEAFTKWSLGYQRTFVDTYGDFFDGQVFPDRLSKIRPAGEATAANELKFKDAVRSYKYFQQLHSYQSSSDYVWKDLFHGIADIIDNRSMGKTARFLSDRTRKLGDKGNLIVKYPKAIVSAAYIHLNPIRQWVIQPAQMLEMQLVNPGSWGANLRNMIAVRAYLMSADGTHKIDTNAFRELAKKGMTLTQKEFDETITAIQKSGLLESIQKNELVNDMYGNSDQLMNPTKFDKITGRMVNSITKPIGAIRSVGFDFGELSNRIGMYLQAKSLWQKQNPTKDWRDIDNQATIAHEGFKLSGAMDRSGSLPYQTGSLAVFLQFAAVQHKLTLNLLQDSATLMTGADRAKLGAVRLVMYGGLYGLPAGALIDWAKGELTDEPFLKDPEKKLIFERGLTDYVVNRLISPMLDDDGTRSEILVGKSLSPYSEHLIPPVTLIFELSKLIDGNPNTDPRFPALGLTSSVVKTANQMRGWTTRKDMGPTEKITEIMGEAFETASGYNNWVKGNLMLSSRQIVSARGSDLGEEISVSESLWKMILGGENQKQLETYAATSNLIEHKAHLKQTAKDTYAQLTNMTVKLGTKEYEDKISQMSSMFSALVEGGQFTKQDIVDISNQVWTLDRMSIRDGKNSIYQALWEQNYNDLNDEFTDLLRILEGSTNPKAQKFIEMWKNRDKML
jgi:hypothetical protein